MGDTVAMGSGCLHRRCDIFAATERIHVGTKLTIAAENQASNKRRMRPIDGLSVKRMPKYKPDAGFF